MRLANLDGPAITSGPNEPANNAGPGKPDEQAKLDEPGKQRDVMGLSPQAGWVREAGGAERAGETGQA